MGLDLIPRHLRGNFHFDEREHASAILAQDYPVEFNEIIGCLDDFWLKKSAVLTPGGGRSPIPIEIDSYLQRPDRGWKERRFDTRIIVDGVETPSPTHKIDNFKNGIGVEVEWNNKTEFFDRDLNNFRLLRQLHVLAVGIIITRLTELQQLFTQLGKGASYGNSTTHWNKLIPKVDGGGAGGCPLLLIGMGVNCYREDL